MLTIAEQSEFTALNAMAFDLVRVRSQRDGLVPPCWLCMSEDARREARQDFCRHLADMTGSLTGFTEESAARFLSTMESEIAPQVERWRHAETEYKRIRESGNPRAYFAE